MTDTNATPDTQGGEQGRDPAALLAQALRAQAAFAPGAGGPSCDEEPPAELAKDPGPLPSKPGTPTFSPYQPGTGGPITAATPSGYGLLSGTGPASLEAERAALESTSADSPSTRAETNPPGERLPVIWVLALAVLLGLAAGSVVGMLTLL